MIRCLLALLFAVCLTLASVLAPMFQRAKSREPVGQNPLFALIGDSRRLFANQFFVMADVYYHSGYYPSMFDMAKRNSGKLDVTNHNQKEKDDEDVFMGKPRDWIEAFGRHFMPTVHTHLSGENSREILPWLKLSAEMDPSRIDTYVTASYWLRTALNQPEEAEAFVREGLKANPWNLELLLELGKAELENKNDPKTARNIWEIAVKKWDAEEKAGLKPDPYTKEELLAELVEDDKKVNNLRQELADVELLKAYSPRSQDTLQGVINELKRAIAAGHDTNLPAK